MCEGSGMHVWLLWDSYVVAFWLRAGGLVSPCISTVSGVEWDSCGIAVG